MKKGRIEAFSDGVIAVALTIMVLEMKAPHGTDWAALATVLPSFLTYVLSFVYIAIYWNNHHHLLQMVEHVSGGIMWTNLYLLFWITLVPFATSWMGDNHFAALPTALYGFVLLMAAVAYAVLVNVIVRCHGGAGSALAQAIGRDFKGKLSVVAYAVAIALAFVDRRIADAIYALVALMWLVPDRRIASRVQT